MRHLFALMKQTTMSHHAKLTVSALVEANNQFLLVEEQTGTHAGTWNLPGGDLKNSEDIFSGVVRETTEETGLVVRPDFVVGLYQCPRTEAGNNLTRLVVACSVVGGTRRDNTVQYFGYEKIKELDEAGRLANAGLLSAIKDKRKGRGIGLSIVTTLPKHPKH